MAFAKLNHSPIHFVRRHQRLFAVGALLLAVIIGAWGAYAATRSITAVTPSSGSTLGGTQVTIKGADFPSTRFEKISAGLSFSCGLASGDVYCWGTDEYRTLGDGPPNIVPSLSPTPVVKADGVLKDKTVTDLAAGSYHACAVADGQVYCWGHANYGRLGNNSTTANSDVPVPAVVADPGLAGKTVTGITANNYQTCVVANGEVYCWGYNNTGRLGDGTTTQRTTPAPVVKQDGVLAGKTVTSISAGTDHTCAVADGQVYCWGANGSGQLGTNNTTASLVPIAVVADAAGLAGKTVTDVAAGTASTCAIADGQAYCWGLGTSGQLGDGTLVTKRVPTAVKADAYQNATLTSISTSNNTICATTANQQIYCWGSNSTYGKFGAGTTVSSSSVPVLTQLAEPTSQVSVGDNHVCSATVSSGAYCWGQNTLGQTGNGAISTRETVPVATGLPLMVPTVTVDGAAAKNVTRIDASTVKITTPARATQGSVDVAMQFSNGDTATAVGGFRYIAPLSVAAVSATSSPMTGGGTVTLSGAGFASGMRVWFGHYESPSVTVTNEASATVAVPASLSAGPVAITVSLPDEQRAVLGDSFVFIQSNQPAVSSIAPSSGAAIGGTAVTIEGENFPTVEFDQIDVGNNSACGVSAGQVYCWGTNTNGAVGDGTTVSPVVAPKKVVQQPGMLAGKHVSKVSVGNEVACALAGGEAYCWGIGTAGRLGNGASVSSSVPVKVTNTGVLAGKTITDISVGWGNSCVVADGQVFCWGYGTNGALGRGVATSSSLPVAVDMSIFEGKAVSKLSVGWYGACAVAGGQIYCWGANANGAAGDGTVTNATTPVKVVTYQGGLYGKTVIDVSRGHDTSCALTSDNELYCWGDNGNGQIADGTTTDRVYPVKLDLAVAGGAKVKSISTSSTHACASFDNGKVYCWGSTSRGRLGDGTTTATTKTPTEVTNMTSARQVRTGNETTCAITATGTQCWGIGSNGTLGNSTTTSSQGTPTAQTQMTGIESIHFGENVMTEFRQISATQLYGLTPAAATSGPVDVMVKTVMDQSASVQNGFEYIGRLAVTGAAPSQGPITGGDTVTLTGENFKDGMRVTFGIADALNIQVISQNQAIVTTPTALNPGPVNVTVTGIDGQMATLVDGFTYTDSPPLVTSVSPDSGQQPGGTRVTITGQYFKGAVFESVASGTNFNCGLAVENVYCWGLGTSGQIGNGASVSANVPTAVEKRDGVLAGKRISKLAVGWTHSCVVAEGDAYCWGANNYAQLGTRTTGNSNTPVQVVKAGSPLEGKNITDVVAGNWYTCVVADGQVYCWGYGGYGRLGNGATTNQTVPVAVKTDTNVLAGKTISYINGGAANVCVIAGGEVYCWGYGTSGQLGTGVSSSSSVPAKVMQEPGILEGKRVTNVVSGDGNTCAIADGSLYCWGKNASYQLLDGTTTVRNKPVVANVAGTPLEGKTIRSVAMYNDTLCAVADAGAYCWGSNTNGRVGDGTTTSPVRVPKRVSGLSTVYGVSAGSVSHCATTDDGVYCWGAGVYGQLGSGAASNSYTPVAVKRSGSVPVVAFNGVEATDVVHVNATTIEATTPPSEMLGLVPVSVKLSTGLSGELPDAFRYIGPPSITSVTPNSGPLEGGSQVTIKGKNFNETANVLFNGSQIDSTYVDSETLLITIPPSTAEAAVAIEVKNSDGQSAKLDKAYTYQYEKALLAQIDPNFGPAEGGQKVTITGQNFMAPALLDHSGYSVSSALLPSTMYGSEAVVVGDGIYMFGGSRNTTFRVPVSNPTQWTDLGLTVPGNLSYSPVAVVGDTIYRYSADVIYSAPVSNPTQWTDTGKRLPSARSARYGEIVIAGDTMLILGGNSTNQILQASTSDPTTWTLATKTLPLTLNYTRAAVIGDYIYAFGGSRNVIYRAPVADPTTWSDTGKTLPVTANQSVFVAIGQSLYLIGGTSSDDILKADLSDPLTWQNLGSILNKTNYGATSALVGDKLYIYGGIESISSSRRIHSFPVSGLQRAAYQDTWSTSWQASATGTATYQVLLGGAAATDVKYINGTTIEATTPEHTGGAVDVLLRSPDGSESTLTNGYTYTAPPEITEVSPNNGATAGGDAITITGTGFLPGATVKFGEQAVPATVVNSTTITVSTPPAERSGAVRIVVTNLDGQSYELSGGYTYTASQAVIDSITPNTGGIGGGTEVKITGSNFDAKLMRQVTVTNPSAQTLYDYRVLVELPVKDLKARGVLKDDLSDIRISAADGTQLYYELPSNRSTDVVQIWVAVASLPSGDTTLYLSYGDQSLADESAKLPTRKSHANDIVPTSVSTMGALMSAWTSNNQDTCSAIWRPGGAHISSSTIKIATQAGYDFGSVLRDEGVQLYRSSGDRTIEQLVIPSAYQLQSCIKTNASTQRGFGIDVPTVQVAGALVGTVSDNESSNISVRFAGQSADILKASSSELLVRTPAHTTVEMVDVELRNQLALAPTVAADAFTYVGENYAITTEPFVVRANQPGQITVAVRDADGQPLAAQTDVELQLSSDSTTGEWSLDGTDWSTSAVKIPSGSSEVSMWYRDSAKGSPTLTVTPPAGEPVSQKVAIGARYNLVVTGLEAPVRASVPQSVTVQVRDYTDQPSPDYQGTIGFSSGDAMALLPSEYTYRTSDAGNRTFINSLTFRTSGHWCVTAADTTDADISGELCVDVLDPPVGTPASLRVITPEQSVPAGASSSTITVQTWDAGDDTQDILPAPAPVATDTTVYVRSSSTTGEFSLDGDTWTSGPFELKILAGTTSANVYYRDTTSGLKTLLFGDEVDPAGGDFGLRNAEHTANIGVGAPAKLTLTNNQTTRTGEWTPITVGLTDVNDEQVTADRNVPVVLGASGGQWSLKVDGSNPSSELAARVPMGHQTLTVYYQATTVGDYQLSVAEQIAEPTLSPNTSTISVSVGEAAQAVFIEPASHELAGKVEGEYHLQLQDLYGNVATATETTTIDIASSSATGSFAAQPLTVQPGESTASVKYTDSTLGDVVLTATFKESKPTLELSIVAGPYAGLGIEDLADSAVAGEPTPLYVKLVDANGYTTKHDQPIELDLSSLTGGEYALSADGEWTPAAKATVVVGSEGIALYYRNTKTGDDTVTAVHTLDAENAHTATQTIRVDAAAPTVMKFMTAPQTVVRDQASAAIELDLFDEFGNPSPAIEDTEVAISSTSDTGAYSDDGESWNPTGLFTVPAGADKLTLYYRDSVSGSYQLEVVSMGAEQAIEIVEPLAASFEITAASTVAAGESTPVTIALRDIDGNPTKAREDMTLELGSSDGGAFISSTDQSVLNSAVVKAGSESVELMYRNTKAGEATITATYDTITAEKKLTVTAAQANHIQFGSPEHSVVAGKASPPITLEIVDEFGNKTTASEPTSVTIATSSSTGTLQFGTEPADQELTFDIAADVPSVDLIYLDTAIGTHTLSVTLATGAVVTQTITITEAPRDPAAIAIATQPQTVVAGKVSGEIAIELRDDQGGVVAALQDTTVTIESGSVQIVDASGSPLTTIVIPAGSSRVIVHATGTTAGEHILKVASGTFTTEQVFDISPDVPALLKIESAPQTVEVRQATEPIKLVLYDQYNNQAWFADEQQLALTANSTTEFSAAAEPWAAIQSVTLAQEQSVVYVLAKSTKPGTITLGASVDGLEAAQDLTVTPAPAAVLVFSTTARSVVAGNDSESLTVELRDAHGDQVVAAHDTELTITSSSSTGVITPTPVTILAGEASASFTYNDTTTGEHTLTVGDTAGLLTVAEQTITVTPRPATQVLFQGDVLTSSTDDRLKVTVTAADDTNKPVVSDVARVVSLKTTGGGAYYSDATSTQALTEVTIPVGESSVDLYYAQTSVGAATLTAESNGLTPGTLDVSFVTGVPAKVEIVTDPQTMIAGGVSGAITVRVLDANGNVVTPDQPILLALSADDGEFRDANGDVMTALTIKPGESIGSAQFATSSIGEHTVTIKLSDSVTATQIITVQSGPVAAIKFTAPIYQLERGGITDPIELTFYNEHNVKITAPTNTTVTVTGAASTSQFALQPTGPWSHPLELSVASGASSIRFVARDDQTIGDSQVTVHMGALTAQATIHSSSTEPAALELMTTPQEIEQSTTSSPIVIEARNQYGTPVVADAPLAIEVSSSSATGEFSTDGVNWQPTITATITPGQSRTQVLYRDTTIGAHSLSFHHGAITAQQMVTVTTPNTTPVLPATLQFSGSDSAVAGQPVQYTVCALDVNGNVLDSYSGDVTVMISPLVAGAPTTVSLVAGCAIFSVTYAEAGNYSLGVTTDNGATTTSPVAITVTQPPTTPDPPVVPDTPQPPATPPSDETPVTPPTTGQPVDPASRPTNSGVGTNQSLVGQSDTPLTIAEEVDSYSPATTSEDSNGTTKHSNEAKDKQPASTMPGATVAAPLGGIAWPAAIVIIGVLFIWLWFIWLVRRERVLAAAKTKKPGWWRARYLVPFVIAVLLTWWLLAASLSWWPYVISLLVIIGYTMLRFYGANPQGNEAETS